jgi:transcriptional regulator with XRE-family HTH domain
MKKEFGKVLRALRLRKGLTQEQVAERLGIRKSAVSRYESGQDGPTLYLCAAALASMTR